MFPLGGQQVGEFALSHFRSAQTQRTGRGPPRSGRPPASLSPQVRRLTSSANGLTHTPEYCLAEGLGACGQSGRHRRPPITPADGEGPGLGSWRRPLPPPLWGRWAAARLLLPHRLPIPFPLPLPPAPLTFVPHFLTDANSLGSLTPMPWPRVPSQTGPSPTPSAHHTQGLRPLPSPSMSHGPQSLCGRESGPFPSPPQPQPAWSPSCRDGVLHCVSGWGRREETAQHGPREPRSSAWA